MYNPRRKIGRTPKLQSNWEGPVLIIKKLSDVVFCIQKSSRHRKKIVYADRLAPFYEKRNYGISRLVLQSNWSPVEFISNLYATEKKNSYS